MKRYVVIIDAYVWAENDERAREISEEYAKHLECMEGYAEKDAKVIGLCEQPIGQTSSRIIKLED